MDLTTSHYIQLIVALVLGAGLFLAAYWAPERLMLGFVVLLIPYQPLTSRFGGINEVLIYVVFIVYFMRGRIKQYPLIGAVIFILFAYALSFTNVARFAYLDNLVYLSAIAANFMIFYLIYNFLIREQDWRFIWNIFIAINVTVIIYCLLQVFFGTERFQLFGIADLSLNTTRVDAKNISGRLTGPFKATAMTSEAIVILILITAYAVIHETRKRQKIFFAGLIGADSAFLIATGNRGGIITLVIGAVLLLFVYRRELGMVRIVTISFIGVLLFMVASVVIIRHTQFNALYERLAVTEFDGIVPDSRAGWLQLWPRIVENPVIGHGPRMQHEGEATLRVKGYRTMPYPHSAYLYLIYTIGFLGLLAYSIFFLRVTWRYVRSRSLISTDVFLNGLPRLGLVIMVVFAVSEFRMEMFRYILRDYQQFFFIIMAVFLAASDVLRGKMLAARSALVAR